MVMPTFAGRSNWRQHLLGVGVRDRVHHRHGRLLPLRFRTGKWKTMRVIETPAEIEE